MLVSIEWCSLVNVPSTHLLQPVSRVHVGEEGHLHQVLLRDLRREVLLHVAFERPHCVLVRSLEQGLGPSVDLPRAEVGAAGVDEVEKCLDLNCKVRWEAWRWVKGPGIELKAHPLIQKPNHPPQLPASARSP